MAGKTISLDDIRQRFKKRESRFDEPEPESSALPTEMSRGKVDTELLRLVKSLRGKFKPIRVAHDRFDLVINFGAHRTKRVSQLAQDSETLGYLRWMLHEDFPDEAKEIIQQWVDDYSNGDAF